VVWRSRGHRPALQLAAVGEIKRSTIGAVDAIATEDLGKLPDQNVLPLEWISDANVYKSSRRI
jgi:hypothetical protein